MKIPAIHIYTLDPWTIMLGFAYNGDDGRPKGIEIMLLLFAIAIIWSDDYD